MIEEIYLNLSGIYDGFVSEINLTNVSSTNCYCDDYAKKILRDKLKDLTPEGLHFIDSGNYHYLSYFFLEKIKEDFALILIDHHPDYQPPSFGDILSCGGWVKTANDTLPHLKRVYMIEVDEGLYGQLKEVPENVCLLKKDEIGKIAKDLPIYISIDKDALCEKDAATDWDQGDMKIEELMEVLHQLQHYKIIGIDVSGEKKEMPTDKEKIKNKKTNEFIRKSLDL
ncbi:MAG: arginase [Lachnospiraceae bacterium]|nr:arginase [Lachnospiraceae bacterium]